MLVRLLVLVPILVALAVPPPALAQSAFTPLTPPMPSQQPAPEPEPAADDGGRDDGGLTRTQEILIALGGIALLFGIGWAIVRDARSAAPAIERARPRTEPGEPERRRGTRPPRRRRVATNRTKAKRARRDRKRTIAHRSRRAR
jgi:hypothetical protein